MKGVSDIIAVLLMLIITIGLAALAYSYIMGIWGSRTGVILSIDAQATSCSGDTLTVYVKNEGSVNATNVQVKYGAPGSAATKNCGTIPTIVPGTEESVSCTKTGGGGYYTLLVTASGASPVRGQVYCSS